MHTKKSKHIRDIDRSKKANYEGSPYWQWLLDKELFKFKGNDPDWEPLEANPDFLSEENSLYHTELGDEAAFLIETIEEAFKELSAQEKQIVTLCGYSGMSLQDAAERMDISKGTASIYLNRARKKIQKFYVLQKAKFRVNSTGTKGDE